MSQSVTRKQIIEFMREVSIMSVAAIAPDGPVSSILLFAVDEDFTLYFSTHGESRKAKALAHNPHIALSVWKYNEMLVQADGIATPIEDTTTIDTVFDKLANAVSKIKDFWPPVVHIEGDHYTIYKVKLTRMSVLPMNNLTIHDYRNPFISVTLPA